MAQLQFTIPTLFGLEGVCAQEVRRLGLSEVRAENENFDRLSVEFTRLEERFLRLEKEIEQEKAEDMA